MQSDSITTTVSKEEKHEKIRQLIEDHKKDVLEKIKNRNNMKSIISAKALGVPYSSPSATSTTVELPEERPEEKRITISISNNPSPTNNNNNNAYKKRKSSFFDLDDDHTPPHTPSAGGSANSLLASQRPKYKNELTTCHFCKKRDRRPKTRCSACGVKYWMGDCCRDCFEQNIKGENFDEVIRSKTWLCYCCRKVCPCPECVAGITKGRRYGPRKLKDLPKADYPTVLPFPSVSDQFPLMLPSLFHYTRPQQQQRPIESVSSTAPSTSTSYSTKMPSLAYMHTSPIKHALPAPVEIDQKPILIPAKQQFKPHPTSSPHQSQPQHPPPPQHHPHQQTQVQSSHTLPLSQSREQTQSQHHSSSLPSSNSQQDKLQNTIIHINPPSPPIIIQQQPTPVQTKRTPPREMPVVKHEVITIHERPLPRTSRDRDDYNKTDFPQVGASVQAVGMWLEDNGMREYIAEFSNNKIDGEAMHELGEEDLKALGVHAIGDRKKILRRIKGAHYRICDDQITEITTL